MRYACLAVLTASIYLLHQDVWFWDSAHPILFGVLPIGLAYHVLYSIVAAGLMWLLVRHAWPAHIEAQAEAQEVEGVEKADR